MAFEVVSYTPAAFRDLLIALSVAEAPQVDAKLASGYWDQYLAAIGVRTIVTESDYIDHDYFEDFSAYYVKWAGRSESGRDRSCRLELGFPADDPQSVPS